MPGTEVEEGGIMPEMKEDDSGMVPAPSPIIVQDTINNKSLWTVTRERPKQFLAAAMDNPQNGPRILKKVRRRLIQEEKNKLRRRRIKLQKVEDGKLEQQRVFKEYQDKLQEQYLQQSQLQLQHHQQYQDDNPAYQYEGSETEEYADQTVSETSQNNNPINQEYEDHIYQDYDGQAEPSYEEHTYKTTEEDSPQYDFIQYDEVPRVTVSIGNEVDYQSDFNEDERRAISLKEAFDMAINKVGVETEPREEEEREPGNRIGDILYGDSRARARLYVDSTNLRRSP